MSTVAMARNGFNEDQVQRQTGFFQSPNGASSDGMLAPSEIDASMFTELPSFFGKPTTCMGEIGGEESSGDMPSPNMSMFPGLGVAFVPSAPASLSFNLAPAFNRPNKPSASSMALPPPPQQQTQAGQGGNGIASFNGQGTMATAGPAGEFSGSSEWPVSSFNASKSPIGAPVKSPQSGLPMDDLRGQYNSGGSSGRSSAPRSPALDPSSTFDSTISGSGSLSGNHPQAASPGRANSDERSGWMGGMPGFSSSWGSSKLNTSGGWGDVPAGKAPGSMASGADGRGAFGRTSPQEVSLSSYAMGGGGLLGEEFDARVGNGNNKGSMQQQHGQHGRIMPGGQGQGQKLRKSASSFSDEDVFGGLELGDASGSVQQQRQQQQQHHQQHHQQQQPPFPSRTISITAGGPLDEATLVTALNSFGTPRSMSPTGNGTYSVAYFDLRSAVQAVQRLHGMSIGGAQLSLRFVEDSTWKQGVLAVQGTPASVQNIEIISLCCSCGEVMDVRGSGSLRLVSFYDIRHAYAAMSLTGSEMHGAQVSLIPAMGLLMAQKQQQQQQQQQQPRSGGLDNGFMAMSLQDVGILQGHASGGGGGGGAGVGMGGGWGGVSASFPGAGFSRGASGVNDGGRQVPLSFLAQQQQQQQQQQQNASSSNSSTGSSPVCGGVNSLVGPSSQEFADASFDHFSGSGGGGAGGRQLVGARGGGARGVCVGLSDHRTGSSQQRPQGTGGGNNAGMGGGERGGGGGGGGGGGKNKGVNLFHLDLAKVMRGDDTRTTLMIRNIPNKYSQKMLLSTVDEKHKGKYDFLYLPIDFKNKCNVGYAFINFICPKSICDFHATFNHRKWDKFNSDKVCELAYARIQGKQCLITHFQNSSLMTEDKKCRPLIFFSEGPNQGTYEPFPVGPNVRRRNDGRRESDD